MCPLGGNASSRNSYSRTDKGGQQLGTWPHATPRFLDFEKLLIEKAKYTLKNDQSLFVDW
jgi:hypothetical protein